MPKHTAAEDMRALEPCPFCGEAGHVQENDWCEPPEFFVTCDTVDCSGMGKYKPTEKEAIAAWNRRAALTPVHKVERVIDAHIERWKVQPGEVSSAFRNGAVEGLKFLRESLTPVHTVGGGDDSSPAGGEVSRSQTAAPFASKPPAPFATYDADCGELIELAACLEADPAFNPQTNAVYVRALRNGAASICGLARALFHDEWRDIASAPMNEDVLVWRPHRRLGSAPHGVVRARQVPHFDPASRWEMVPPARKSIYPTHWMPLLSGPEQVAANGAIDGSGSEQSERVATPNPPVAGADGKGGKP
jgi:Lar family restriction alleviation protein